MTTWRDVEWQTVNSVVLALGNTIIVLATLGFSIPIIRKYWEKYKARPKKRTDKPEGLCKCKYGVESDHHFLLHCPLYHRQRRKMFNSIDKGFYVTCTKPEDRHITPKILLGHTGHFASEMQTVITDVVSLFWSNINMSSKVKYMQSYSSTNTVVTIPQLNGHKENNV